MSTLLILRWIHLIAAATWLGGQITLGALIVTLRRSGADRAMLQATARQFARVAWSAMAVAVATGLLQVWWSGLSLGYGRLHTKLGAVTAAIALTAIHQVTARRTSARARGVLQVLILLASLAIFAAAVAM